MRLLANARDVVDLLAEGGPATPADIAEGCGVPRPSVYRLVDGLVATGLVTVRPDGRVALDLRWLGLADAARQAMSEWSAARAVLDELAGTTGQTAFLTVPRPDGAVCVDWAPGRGIGILVLRPGRSLPLHAGGAGRAVLAFGGLDLDAVLAAAPFERLTPATLVTAAQLRADVADSRRQGHVVSDEDVTVGIGAVAVPVLDGSGVLRGCLSLGGLSADVRRRREEFLTALHGAVAAVRPAGGRGVDGPSVG